MNEGAAKSGPLRESIKQANRVLAENAVSESEDDSDSENETAKKAVKERVSLIDQ